MNATVKFAVVWPPISLAAGLSGKVGTSSKNFQLRESKD
jgi:hypothetical protein